MAVSLIEVAKKASVSIATASMAIRDHKKVSDKTRVKVKKVAKELGFRPNAWARALALGRAETLVSPFGICAIFQLLMWVRLSVVSLR